MTTVPFFLVDVFAERPLTGNPLALVAEAERLDDASFPAIAREFNQSETTFLLPPTRPGATWRLRSLTAAGAEVVGAGHNALGAWWWLATAGGLGTGRFAQELGDRVLPVEILADDDGRPAAVVLEQAPPTFRATVAEPAPLAAALAWRATTSGPTFPAQVVDTGAAHLLVPLVDRAAVDRAEPDARALLAELRAVEGQGCYVYAVEPDATAYARFFNPTVGIHEDPATGSAAGPLACQLVAAGVVGDRATVFVEQGHRLGRPSRIQVDVDGQKVRIGGAGVVVARQRRR